MKCYEACRLTPVLKIIASHGASQGLPGSSSAPLIRAVALPPVKALLMEMLHEARRYPVLMTALGIASLLFGLYLHMFVPWAF